MAVKQQSTKRIAIDKASARLVIILAVTSFVTIFCLVASSAVWQKNTYLYRVINEKEKAKKQLKDNLKEYTTLVKVYRSFDHTSTNIINGNSSGPGDNDGPNSKIVLDALPSSYDFPALTSSLEKLLNDRHYKIGNLSGTDDQATQESNFSSTSPTTVEIPFEFSINESNYTGSQSLISALEHSIRPFQIDKMSIDGGNDSMSLSISAHTFYQPAVSLELKTKVVK